ncbi:uncharacterized protein LOC119070917 [Bradysia coprophila]|uniref:uncharacterized protein LOC119070917 n=1 Tax=Bradysia coprophila TaxID=38358 RepID=UPI00187D7686|nr:uncharacterized protein LOC119070917 [Bradysia coprophila]
MTRSQFITAVKYLTLLFVAVPMPVHSVMYQIVFDPAKFMIPCKDTKNDINEFFDLTKLNISLASESTMKVTGTLAAYEDYGADTPLSVHQSAKQKVRGRWVDTPYRSVIKDLCADYFKPGMWWYENVTKYFVGEERQCPPKKGLPLPLNTTVELVLNIPLRLPPGEYISHTIMKHTFKEACFECYVDLSEAK